MISSGHGTSECVFERLLNAVLPNGGILVSLAEVYIDESGSHNGSPLLCLAGYIFLDRHARRYSRQLRQLLVGKNLPYFRMSACAHGNEPFCHLALEERV